MGGLEAIDPGYAAVLEGARAVFDHDDRVVSWDVRGSVAEGRADEWSDLDLTVLVRDDAYRPFLDEWEEWLGRITPMVCARRPIASFVINAVTEGGLTVDLAIYAASGGPPARAEGYTVGMLSSQRFTELGPALEYAVVEQLRGLAGPFISYLQREEHLRSVTGAPHLIGLLVTVFLAETGSPPPGKLLNLTLSPEQQATVAKMPAVGPTRESVIDWSLWVAREIVTRGRVLFPRYGLEWPSALEAVAARRLREKVGLDVSDWLSE